MTAILKPSTDFLTSNKLLKVTYIHTFCTLDTEMVVVDMLEYIWLLTNSSSILQDVL